MEWYVGQGMNEERLKKLYVRYIYEDSVPQLVRFQVNKNNESRLRLRRLVDHNKKQTEWMLKVTNTSQVT